MRRTLVAALAIFSLSAGCRPPEYADYRSIWADWSAPVPWGWQVLTDQQHHTFTQTTFIGPFDADFFLGAPSLSVRWYKNGAPHRLRDGRIEAYANVQDFYKQIIRDVYGSNSLVVGTKKEKGDYNDPPSEIALKRSGLKALYFTVVSPAPAPAKYQWGISEGKDGKPAVLRKHSYALVPLDNGFYVLCYPATSKGFERHEERFRSLIGGFLPLTAGPNGPALKRGSR